MCPSGTWLGHVHFLRYVLVLDIFCQQLWVVVQVGGCPIVLYKFCQQLWSFIQLGGVCVPFGHLVGACTFSEILICIEYILPTNVGI